MTKVEQYLAMVAKVGECEQTRPCMPTCKELAKEMDALLKGMTVEEVNELRAELSRKS